MKFEKLTKKDQNNKELFLEQIKVLTKFDTEGYDEYDALSFKKEIKEKNIDPKKTLESYLEYLVKNDKHGDFSVAEMNFHSGMRAWLHCDYKEAISFIEEKFNFYIKNGDNLDFVKKYKFLNLVSIFIFENMNVDEESAAQSNIVSNERSVFSKLKDAKNKENNSFLLNYFASDFCSVIDKERLFVKGEKLEYVPFEIAPKTFALDKKSHFVMISKNNLKEDSLYVSDPKNFEKIQEILRKVKENTFPEQEIVDELIPYFNPISVLNKDSKDLDMQMFRKLNEPYHRDKLKEVTGIDFSQISIDEQFYFLNYLKFSNQDDLAQIKEFSEKYNESGFKTFLSIAHGGQEMGDKILNLAQKLEQKDAKKIFDGYAGLVDSAEAVRQELEKAINNSQDKSELEIIPTQVYQSLLMRTKDILIGAEKIASGNTNEKFVVKDVVDAIEGMKIFLDIIADLDKRKDFDFKKTSNDKNSFKYLVKDKLTELEYNLKLFIRPLPEPDAQARINMELSFDTVNPNENLQKAFYNETEFYTQGGKKNAGSVIRMGIDRDDNGVEPAVSLDIGRSEHTGEKFTRTGDVLGRLLVHATDSHIGHHTTEAFDKKFAEKETFAKIAEALKKYLGDK